MATIIGRILLIPKGDYSGSETYNMLDLVRHDGIAWVCKVNGTVGVVPAETAPEWQVLAKDGSVSGSIAWNAITGKPFNGVGNGLNVDGSNNIELDIDMLTGSNISYDNTSSGLTADDIQSAIDELAGSSTDVSWNQIQGATGGTKIAEIEIDGTTQEVYAPTGGGGGMLPYLYIDSEAGATVTVNQPDGTSITPTAAGSGHWECELTGGYGTYVIHSVLAGQGDATQSLAVDTVKEYHVTDTHYDFTINVTAPSGSTVRIVGGGETYTGTGTGSPQAFAVHTPSTTYTVTATQIMDGNTKTDEATVTSASTSGGSTNVTLSIEFGTINVTVAADFVTAGSTITCVNGGTSCTPKTAASTLVFRVPTTGTWTISGEISGTPYSIEAEVTSLSVPVSRNLQTTVTINVTLYSATEDTVSFTDASGTSRTEVLASGQSSKTISLTIMPSGSDIIFTSSVAENPNNLGQTPKDYYSKTVNVTPSTTDIYVMPEGEILYWYGYKSDNIRLASTVLRFTNYSAQGSLSKNTNSVSLSGWVGNDGVYNGFATVDSYDLTNFSTFNLIGMAGTNATLEQGHGGIEVQNTDVYSPDLNRMVAMNYGVDTYGTLDISSRTEQNAIGYLVKGYKTDTPILKAMWLD